MNTDQNKYVQEDEMANGPVSAGASNKDAPMYNNNQKTHTGDQNESYNKMIGNEASGPMQGTGMANDQVVGSPGGGTLPSSKSDASDAPRGGRNTSSSTVSGGSSSAGAVAGLGEHRDRGAMTDVEDDATSNTADMMQGNSQPQAKTTQE